MYDFDTVIDRRNNNSAKWDQIAQEMGPGSEDIIPLSVADMEFKVAPEIVEAIRRKADFALYGYSIPDANYYDAVIGWMERRHHWKIKQEWISLSPGVVPAFFTAVNAFTHPGDKVIIQPPVYYPFSRAVVQNGCELVNNPLVFQNGRYTMNFDDLEKKAQDPRVRALILCSPHNPVGRVWSREELLKLGEICVKHKIIVIADEIHFDFVFKPHEHTVFATLSEEFRDNSLILTAPSKTFNLAGLQCSNIIIPNPVLKNQFDIALQNTGFFSLNYFAYAGCEAAYGHGEAWLNELLPYLEGNKNYLKTFIAENLPQITVIETEGTYLVWMDCRSLGLNDKELEKLVKEKGRVFLDDGYIFGQGGSGFERVNIACPRSILEKSLTNIKKAIDHK
jgi:cystathionine beta-lyase